MIIELTEMQYARIINLLDVAYIETSQTFYNGLKNNLQEQKEEQRILNVLESADKTLNEAIGNIEYNLGDYSSVAIGIQRAIQDHEKQKPQNNDHNQIKHIK